MTLTRCYRFRATHQLPGESGHPGEQNLHGHNYRLEVTLEGSPDPLSGLIFSREEIDKIVNSTVLCRVDGKNLNKYFKWTSGEGLCAIFFEELNKTPLKSQLLKVSLKETEKNWFSVQN